jgi:hypothetical protein
MSLDAPQRGETVLAFQQILLELEFDLGPAETDIPDIGVISVIDAAFAKPVKGSVQDGTGGNIDHPVRRISGSAHGNLGRWRHRKVALQSSCRAKRKRAMRGHNQAEG